MHVVDVSRVDVDGVIAAMARLARFGRDLRPVFKEARGPLMRDQKEHRKQQSGPDGKWPALSPFTIERQKARARSKGKRRPRIMLGKLPMSLRVYTSSKALRVENRADWSGVHQDGAGRTGHAPSIPARRFLWISDRVLVDFVDIIKTHAEKWWLA